MNTFLFELATRSLILAGIGLGLRYALLRSSAHGRANILALTMGALALLPIALLSLPRMPITVARHEIYEAPLTGVAGPVAQESQFTFPWLMIWGALAGIMLIRIAVSLVQFRKLEQGFSPASQTLTVRVRELAVRARGVFFCPEGEPPMTWGLLQPKIALPTESEAWIEPQLRSVVLHEDAHIRRRDWAVMIGFRMVTAIYWFNPLVWGLKLLFDQDSERAADDFVLAQGVDAPEYAGRLVEVAKTMQHRHSHLPAVTMARSNRLNGRVAAILSTRTQRGILKGWSRVSVLGVLVLGSVAAGLMVPEVKQVRLAVQTPSDNILNVKPQSSNVNDDQEDGSTIWNSNDSITTVKSANETSNKEVCIVNPPAPESKPQTPAKSKVASEDFGDFKDVPNSSVNFDSLDTLIAEGMAQANREMSRSSSERDREIADAKRQAQRETAQAERDRHQSEREMRSDIQDSLDEAKAEIEKSSKDAEKEMRQAMAEIDKADMPEAARKIAKQSIAMSKGVVNGLFKGLLEGPKPKTKPKNPAPPEQQSKKQDQND